MDEAIRILAMLSEPIRLRSLVMIAEEGELCVCELVAALDLPQPKVSRHLAVMRDAGLLRDRRDAQWVLYSINPALRAPQMAMVEAAVAAVVGDKQIARDKARLAKSSRPERLRNGCRRVDVPARRAS
ncbi:MAG TPA: metalloregulator ArsR/SmtB family transcription factor [Hyphomicrobiaceae bacterium]|nr:metalloregulator ArsR/SmtB family transcription factor [Hyphomicrobiaceae bacterium]